MTNYDSRIARLESFVQRLTLGSYIAKAADQGGRVLGTDLSTGDLDMSDATVRSVRYDDNGRRINGVENRLNKIENKLEAMAEELGDVALRITRGGVIRPSAAEDQALETLAKAVSGGRHRQTPEGLLERAERVVSDPTTMGEIASYVQAGQLKEAAAILAKAEDFAAKTENDQALDQMGEHADKHELEATIAQLTETVANLQHTFNSALSRLSALETRRQVNPSAAQTVAKAQGRRQAPATDWRNTADGLLTRLEAVVDSPARVGTISSMIQGGQLDEARQIIERFEAQHQADMVKRDRKTL